MTVSNPRISVIMVDGGYRPHFGAIDALKDQSIPSSNYEVIWVEYFSSLDPQLVDKTADDARFRLITMDQEGTYHSSTCFNEGIRQARGELLVIVDADVITERDFLETIWRAHETNDRLVMYLYRYDETEQPDVQRLDLEYLRDTCVLRNASNYGGCLTVRKRWLLEINGYEEHDVFRTGGDHANGLDVYTRFKNLGLHVMWHPTHRIFHPWHPSNPNAASLYKPQLAFTAHRALSLDTQPYRGLDRSKDREVPAQLLRRLEASSQDFRGTNQASRPAVKPAAAGRSLVGRVLSRCKSLVLQSG